jgi:hypothetical protein
MGAGGVGSMSPLRANLDFDAWVIHIFNHDAPEIATFDEIMEDIEWDGAPKQKIAYMTQLFEKPRPVLDPYSDLQLQHGFEYLISNLLSNYPLGLHDASVPLDLRARCVRNMYTIFEQVFAERCSPELECTGRRPASALNNTCYMWWDLLPFWSKSFPVNERIIDETALSVMESTLNLKSLPCQESALHGLGHWQSGYPERIGGIIEYYLDRNPTLPAELRRYALNAQHGYVL